MLTSPLMAFDLDANFLILTSILAHVIRGSLLLSSATSKEVAEIISTPALTPTSYPTTMNTKPGRMDLRTGRSLE